MIVYRICREKFSGSLFASGIAARWNLDEQFVLYTSSSRSLAALELLVNSSRVDFLVKYKVMVIEIDVKKSAIQKVDLDKLPENWRGQGAYKVLKQIGSDWYRDAKKLVLQVPSAVITKEFNYVVNTRHPDFVERVSLAEVEKF